MKKFMKGAAITGGIFFLVGLVIMIIGIGCGGIQDMRQKSMDELQRVMDKFEGIEIIDGINISFNGTDFNEDLFDEDKEIYTKGTYDIDDCIASDLEIKVGAGDLTIKSHEEDSVRLEISGNDKMQCYVEDDTLKITGGLVDTVNTNSKMVVYLPEDKIYNVIIIDVGAGNIEIEKLEGYDVDLVVAMGQLVAEEMIAGSLTVEVGMGNAQIKGSANHEVIVECGMGQVTMNMTGKSTDYNYNLDCGLGTLSVENVYYIAGIGDSYVNNNAPMEMNVSVGMGNVFVTFEE